MSFVSESRERTRPILPLAGMVDVLFLLLIFFMTASVFREQEMQMDVALPTAETAVAGDATATQIVVTIDAQNRIFLGNRQIMPDQLVATFSELAEQFPNESVLVRGDRNASYGLAVQVMDMAQQAGIRNVSVATVKSMQDVP